MKETKKNKDLNEKPIKRAIIMRGLPGSGKSTLAKKIASESTSSVICSADDFFMRNGEYKFNPKMLWKAHETCIKKFETHLKKQTEIVILDNTNTKKWEYAEYIELAKTHNYEIEIKIPETSWAFDIDICAKRNSHGVPAEAIERMKERWEN